MRKKVYMVLNEDDLNFYPQLEVPEPNQDWYIAGEDETLFFS